MPAGDGGAPITDASVPLGATLFVSGDRGDDGNDGRDTAHALRSIGAALSLAQSASGTHFEIRVCRGTYAEAPLAILAPVTLNGGYNCTTWERPSDYGYAGGFGPLDETVLSPRANAASGIVASLTLTGAAVDATTAVSGIRVVAPINGTNAAAVLVDNRASPHLHDMAIEGGVSSGPNIGGYGLRVEAASPEVEACRIAAGSGTSTNVGAAGFVVRGGSPSIHDNEIRGGAGDAPQGTFAAYFESATMRASEGRAVRHNRFIVPSFQYRTLATSSAAVGVYVVLSEVDMVDNDVVIEAVTCQAYCLTVGVLATVQSRLHLTRSRIYGGEIAHAADPSSTMPRSAAIIGLEANEGALIYADSNAIHMGASRITERSSRFGVSVANNAFVQLAGNTIFAGYDVLTPVAASIRAIDLAPTGWVSVDGNLFISSPTTAPTPAIEAQAIFALTCDTTFGAHVTHVRNNAFLGFENDVTVGAPEVTPSCPRTTGGLSKLVGVDITGNVSVSRSACSNNTCISDVFPGWTTPSALERLFNPGWMPKNGASCSYLNGGYAPLAGALDARRQPRTAPVTMGAWEVDNCAN